MKASNVSVYAVIVHFKSCVLKCFVCKIKLQHKNVELSVLK